MIYLNGIDENLENLVVLAKSNEETMSFHSTGQLKRGLKNYLIKYQPKAVLDRNAGPIREIKDKETIQIFYDLFSEKSGLNDLQQESLIDLDHEWDYLKLNSSLFQSAFEGFKSIDVGVYDLLQTIFNYYFFANSNKAAGGSTSAGIGILWVNPKDNWSCQDYAEFLIHESTHQLLFYDERRYGHYLDYDKMKQPENYAFSTILKRSRPLDKVIHSLFVGVNVLLFREKIYGLDSRPSIHPESSELIRNMNITLDSLKGLKQELLSERIFSLLNLAKPHLERWNNL